MLVSRTLARCLASLAAVVVLTAGAQAADPQAAAKEKTLIETLRSGAPADKALACKQLAVYGSKASVPELAKLLSDVQLASWARIALEAIPGAEPDEALRTASDTLQGRLLVGTINSIGVRRDAAAVERLTSRLSDADADVASAAAVALGRIGNEPATKSLQQSLLSAAPKVRSAVAEGCILCAERLLSDGKSDAAVKLYDEVRASNVAKQRIVEATRGAILARKTAGIPLLVEQLRSEDIKMFRLGLQVARELPGREVVAALAAELAGAAPDRAPLLLGALADRSDAVGSPAVLQAARRGSKQARIAAIGALPKLGDASSVATLLQIAGEQDADLALAAKGALASLPGKAVDNEILAGLSKNDGKMLAVFIEVVGARRIDATDALVKAVGHADPNIRSAALTALGLTVGPKGLAVLIAQVVSPKDAADAKTAAAALRAASIRMPDREACAEQIAAAISGASAASQNALLEVLGAVGGKKALATLGEAVKSKDELLQDTSSRVLGEWMTVDAAPVLLDLAKNAPGDKYQVRAMRGYIRIARQFVMPVAQRAEMCASALDAADRLAEKKLVLEVLQRYPSGETLKVAVGATKIPELKDDAGRVAMLIAQKLGGNKVDPKDLLAQIGQEPIKLEIVKAEYGAGATQRDVTEIVRKQAGSLPLVSLPSANYNESFGGDPVPNTPKQLKIQYKINGKAGEASFAENAVILLPIPK